MVETELEKRLKEAAVAPRVTQEMVEATIAEAGFMRPEGTNLTICILSLKNGFTVTGESACVSSANFDEKIGQEIAFKQALDKVWAFEGYRLACEGVR